MAIFQSMIKRNNFSKGRQRNMIKQQLMTGKGVKLVFQKQFIS